MSHWRKLAAAKPAVFTIPPNDAFVDCLARGVMDDAGNDPLALAAVTILLPTRRACRALRETFLRLSGGKPLLLPRLIPLNDLDADEALFAGFSGAAGAAVQIPPSVAPLRRQLLLTQLIQRVPWQESKPSPEQAARLAGELARLLDQVQTEQLDFARLKNLVPDAYADHWQETLKFLAIVTEHWPRILLDEGALDPATHRNLLFAAQAEAWRRGAAGPVIAAGSTGSIPATATLLATVAAMPEGCVVLPGLDTRLDEESWDAIDDAHPQFGLKQLLARLDVARMAVKTWPAAGKANKRAHFISEVMRPASTTDAWRSLGGFSRADVAQVRRIDCPSPREEAEIVAVIMRECLETPERTCALVTPDRALAQRVTAELKRWHVDVDDSGGRPLKQTPVGSFLLLLADAVAAAFAPVALLALCKHPLAAANLDPAEFRALSRYAEVNMLRGPAPPPGLAGLRALAATLTEHKNTLDLWLDRLVACCGPYAALMGENSVPLGRLLAAHMEAAEALAGTPDAPGPLRLWAGEAGEAAANFAAELAQSCAVLDDIAPEAYPSLLVALMDELVVRPRYGGHPRLAILGPLEARLQRFDLLILAGLNEGTWPAEVAADPWLSRPMRAQFGLPSHERRIGLAAHDIAQALCAPEVVLTRSLKVGGTPTVPSRWLMRLERALESAGLGKMDLGGPPAHAAWARELIRPSSIAAVAPPAPTPPVAARPRRLSVTEIETWMRDPYGIYAKHVLGLKALDPLEQDAGAADYGSLVHAALQKFIAAYPKGDLPANAFERLREIGRELFRDQVLRPTVMAFWWPRFERIAAWFITHEQTRRGALARSYVEQKGEMKLSGPGGAFTLVAKADRIDKLNSGGFSIIDYKTGAPPRSKEVLAGFSPQLPLEAAIAAAGGFKTVGPADAASLSYWQLHGRKDGGEERNVEGDARALAAEANAGLVRLIAAFDDPATAYAARPSPDLAPAYSDYVHLARVKEWSAAGEDGSEG